MLNFGVAGIDSTAAYTKKAIRGLIGDVALRKQVGLPKSTLGYCAPLALETNGKSVSVCEYIRCHGTCSPKWAILSARRRSGSEINLMFAGYRRHPSPIFTGLGFPIFSLR
jgi:hypothetical protein